MSIKKMILVLFIFGFGLFSCTEPETVSPIIDVTDKADKFGNNSDCITVLTRNVYVGADVDRIIHTENPEQIPLVVAEVFQELLATNFPERAEALAMEIFEQQPHLIGLQEVSLIRMQSPGDAVYEGTIPAEDVYMDYLDILLIKMSSIGLHYEVVAKVENTDVEMPMITSADFTFDDVRLTDYDVILAKKGIQITDVVEKNFTAKIVIPEMGLEMLRGYTAVTSKIKGQLYKFVNTHLEDADQGGVLLDIQLAQAAELLSDLESIKTPIILVGDFNSAATNEPAYSLISSSMNFVDIWLLNSDLSNLDGLTYGHDLDLRNETVTFTKRIDHVFVREGKSHNKVLRLEDVEAQVLGDEEDDKTISGLWPSDHGGVLAKLKFKAYKKQERERL